MLILLNASLFSHIDRILDGLGGEAFIVLYQKAICVKRNPGHLVDMERALTYLEPVEVLIKLQ